MKKTIIALVILVVLLGGAAFALMTMKSKGAVVFKSDPGVAPYQVSVLGGESYICDDRSCSLELEAGEYVLYLEKEGYYVLEENVDVEKGGRVQVDVVFDIVPGLYEDVSGEIDESVFDVCYGDTQECGLSDLYVMEEDEDTGYMALFEGITRRATFTKGMEESRVFIGDYGAIAWDEESGEAYLVDFLEDSRELLFELDEIDGVVFAGDGYLVESGGEVYWFLGDGLEKLSVEGGLSMLTYTDGRIYFVADSEEGVYLGSYDGIEYYTVLEGIDVDLDDVMVGSDEEGVYVKSGGEVFSTKY